MGYFYHKGQEGARRKALTRMARKGRITQIKAFKYFLKACLKKSTIWGVYLELGSFNAGSKI
jgi:hypothetical protein